MYRHFKVGYFFASQQHTINAALSPEKENAIVRSGKFISDNIFKARKAGILVIK
jgi:hypothetical protein